MLYFPLENIIASEIVLRTWCNKPVKVPLTLVHYGKYCTRAWSRGKYSTRLRQCYIVSRPRPCDISRSALTAVLYTVWHDIPVPCYTVSKRPLECLSQVDAKVPSSYKVCYQYDTSQPDTLYESQSGSYKRCENQ